MSRITRLLSHHSFGVKNLLERKKNLLMQTCKPWPSSSFSSPTTIKHQFVIKLTSSSSLLLSEQQTTNTKTTDYLISLSPNFSLTSDYESKIKKYA